MTGYYLPSKSVLVLLGAFNFLQDTLSWGRGLVRKLYRGVRDAFTEKVYYFFEKNPTGFLTSSVNISASSSAVPQWSYLLSKNTFLRWSRPPPPTVHFLELPLLSMEVLENDLVVCDLTEFISTIRVYMDEQPLFPSIAHILGAWSLSSGIILDNTRRFTIRIIDTEANTREYEVNNYEFVPMHQGPETKVTEAEATEATESKQE